MESIWMENAACGAMEELQRFGHVRKHPLGECRSLLANIPNRVSLTVTGTGEASLTDALLAFVRQSIFTIALISFFASLLELGATSRMHT